MKRTRVWRTREGQKIRICDLEDQHLQNILAMLERNETWAKIRIIESGNDLRGDMARDCFQLVVDELSDSGPETVWPIYTDLLDEAEDRGLR